ncbi:MAG: low specificity L-threonine aldolase [Acidimicrobiia bacterium]|nr:beta-eliminating lyase-related protein [bacterium]MXX01544.1 low specificity L-threonine aldolase [Acidimicrobiia bacterium]MXX46537.1 low specificity L-threonine aldolase [Acidimicrobiia bacterium]MXY73612.1 low specificity L-threonine aldolase [Acidimicrobiia bacterium]MYA39254.1 low specificity L-threonine aldolase [Acidimicrobiia bacterium]
MAGTYGGKKAGPVPPGTADFFSDTKSLPTREMRQAAMDAPLGDEQKGEDPTTTELLERVAETLGAEDALFMPSATMANEIAVAVHCSPGDEIITERSSHLVNFEAGGPGVLAGVQTRMLEGVNGIFGADQVAAAIRPKGNLYMPETALVVVEQTANMGGGAVWPLESLREVASVSADAGVATHMDGARLFNAVVKTGVSAKDYAQGYDSVTICFTKGLGCPFGAVLAGSEEFIQRAWRLRQLLGGGLRQSGFMAALCLYALEHNVERLADDHRRASRIASTLRDLELVERVLPAATNIVIFDISQDGPTAAELVDLLLSRRVLVGAFGERRIRIVTHLGVDQSDTDRLCDEVKAILSTG